MYTSKVIFTLFTCLFLFTNCEKSTKIVDGEGNKYESIKIGTQEWLTTDLRTTMCNDGTPINPNSYSWYNNDSLGQVTNGYGALYNWSAVKNCNICPIGWRVPSDLDYTVLSNYLEGSDVAGGKMKEAGQTHWKAPNTEATNESGWSGLPGGKLDRAGLFRQLGTFGSWWTSTKYTYSEPINSAYSCVLSFQNNSLVQGVANRSINISVRCMKDSEAK